MTKLPNNATEEMHHKACLKNFLRSLFISILEWPVSGDIKSDQEITIPWIVFIKDIVFLWNNRTVIAHENLEGMWAGSQFNTKT